VAKVGQLDFAATSTLLAIRTKQQSISPVEQPDQESSDDDDVEQDKEDCVTSRPSPQLATYRRDILINKFLDRLAELFSREKSCQQSRNRRDSEHVAATGWVNSDTKTPLTVVVAKNQGFLDDRDLKMLARLQQWLRLVAITGHVPTIQTDLIWAGDGGLIDFSRQRLWYHISEVQRVDQPLAGPATRDGDTALQIADIQRLCGDVRRDSSVEQLSNIVTAAYDKRCAWKARSVQKEHRKAVRAINMLGRLQAAYECFKSVAFTFEDVSTIEIKPVARCECLMLNVSLFQKLLQEQRVDLGLPKGLLKSEAAEKYRNASSLHVHAEMQILVNLEQSIERHKRTHPYIGVSKKLCFLGDQILRNFSHLAKEGIRRPTYGARECHGKVYPLWTLPHCVDLPCISELSLATAVMYTYRRMRQELPQRLQLQSAIAESSAGVTTVGSLSADLEMMRDQHLADRRPAEPPKTDEEGVQSSELGRKIKSVQVGLLPADGAEPGLVTMTFHAWSKTADQKTIECGREYVPDFRDAWAPYEFDRRYRNITFKGQANKEWDGEYRLYWNENHALGENMTVRTLLGFDKSKKIDIMRRFWYGDVFLMRYSEQPKTFDFDVHNLPFTISQCQAVLEELFRKMWEAEYLEIELGRDRYIDECLSKSEADKYILWNRMFAAIHNQRDETTKLTVCLQDSGGAGNLESHAAGYARIPCNNRL
jgi:hypothetical protein